MPLPSSPVPVEQLPRLRAGAAGVVGVDWPLPAVAPPVSPEQPATPEAPPAPPGVEGTPQFDEAARAGAGERIVPREQAGRDL
ncbi:hypothetical protein IVB02_27125 [Bradyrhizobium sp. 166]|uniref:hypothetical protein n=1 Tax=Bradyrhizobium sp. 166 TaxID=2782638 RepID=UPI001FFA2420|nr:hypothetical protein [Bradyrhizobium sp. 166]MCK1604971.1 hypothetical protein [Bradyrhizobium sp. 166]